MIDRENIIEKLQESAAYFRSSFDAMYGTVACEKFRSWTDAIEQALALLKAQEPVKPTWKNGYPLCGECGYKLHWIIELNNYCPNCGRAVKWE